MGQDLGDVLVVKARVAQGLHILGRDLAALVHQLDGKAQCRGGGPRGDSRAVSPGRGGEGLRRP